MFLVVFFNTQCMGLYYIFDIDSDLDATQAGLSDDREQETTCEVRDGPNFSCTVYRVRN